MTRETSNCVFQKLHNRDQNHRQTEDSEREKKKGKEAVRLETEAKARKQLVLDLHSVKILSQKPFLDKVDFKSSGLYPALIQMGILTHQERNNTKNIQS